MQLTAQQLEFLERLGRTPEGQQLRQLCKAWTEEANANLREKADEHLLREQGRAVMLDELTRYLEGRPTPKPVRDQPRFRELPPGPRG